MPPKRIMFIRRAEKPGVVDNVLSQEGTVLVCWEHKRIPGLVALLVGAPCSAGLTRRPFRCGLDVRSRRRELVLFPDTATPASERQRRKDCVNGEFNIAQMMTGASI
jgi:hypothetical protein